MGWVRANDALPEQIPAISNYADAVALYNKREPYKLGDKKGERPLGAVRRYTRSLIHMHPLLDSRVTCSYYGTHVVSFYADGRVGLSTGGYDTISTMKYMQAVLRNTNHSIVRKHGNLYYTNASNNPQQYLRLPRKSDLIVHPSGQAEGAEDEFHHTMDRVLMRQLRAKYAPFIRYGCDMLTMSQEVWLEESERKHLPVSCKIQLRWGDTYITRRMFFDALHHAMENQDEDQKLQEFFALLRRVGWSAGKKVWRGGNYDELHTCTPAVFKKAMETLIKLQYAGELFIKQPSDKSKIVFDSNAFYVAHGNSSTKTI